MWGSGALGKCAPSTVMLGQYLGQLGSLKLVQTLETVITYVCMRVHALKLYAFRVWPVSSLVYSAFMSVCIKCKNLAVGLVRPHTIRQWNCSYELGRSV